MGDQHSAMCELLNDASKKKGCTVKKDAAFNLKKFRKPVALKLLSK